MADLSGLAMPVLVSAALKSTLVLGAAWLMALALRGRSAAARHLVWTAAAAALLALPLLSISLPSLRLGAGGGLLPANLGLVFHATGAGGVNAAAAPLPAVAGTGVHAAVRAPQGIYWKIWDWKIWLLSIWVAGVLFSMAQMLVACAALRRMRGRAVPSPDRDRVRTLAEGLGIRHEVEVLETAPGGMPMTFGLLRPAIFMPTDAETWTDDRRQMVLLHELAHVRRGDVATHLMARVALSLYWWNPLAWTAWREFLKERERAADDLVLSSGAAATEYAGHLLEVARTMQTAQPVAWAAVAMARPSQLEGRLMAILDGRRNRQQPGRLTAALAAMLAVAVVLPLAALQSQDEPAVAARFRVDVQAQEVDATIRAAMGQKNHQMLEQAAAAFEKLRKFDEAQKLREAALAIREEVSGPQSVDYAVGLTNLGDLARKRGKLADGDPYYAKAVAAVGDRAETAQALVYLSQGAFRTHEFDKAVEFAQRARNVASPGAETGKVMTWMGQIREKQENAADAESLYTGALSQDPPNSPEAALTMEVYARFLRSQQRTSEAEVMDARAAGVRKALVSAATVNIRGTAQTYRVGDGTTPPKLLKKLEPGYTEEARAAKIAGTVLLQIVIEPNGLATDFQLLKGVGFGLDEKAVEAISQWQFQPGTKNGVPVPVQAQVEVNFRLM
ncbi:MAG TPA: TonB family protein [Candidatus Acidoferrales bacterium]|jgi:TonB family protein|nr:TonB family protein [Candidatus Acidoferrales bacterium]